MPTVGPATAGPRGFRVAHAHPVTLRASRPYTIRDTGGYGLRDLLEVASMKNLFKIATVLAVGSLLVTGAFAQGKKPAMKKAPAKPAMQKKAAKAVMCPVCKTMALTTKKTKDNTVAVRLKKGGKVMYCCSKCTMPASVLVKTMPKHHGKKMGMKSKKPMGKKK